MNDLKNVRNLKGSNEKKINCDLVGTVRPWNLNLDTVLLLICEFLHRTVLQKF